jgi:hypothetical protein
MKKKNIALVLFLLLTFAVGAIDAHIRMTRSQHNALELGAILPFSLLLFLWVYHDSAERGYRRPRWLSVCVVAFGYIFIPIYLIKSRPKGARLAALGGFLLVALLDGLLYVAATHGGSLLYR